LWVFLCFIGGSTLTASTDMKKNRKSTWSTHFFSSPMTACEPTRRGWWQRRNPYAVTIPAVLESSNMLLEFPLISSTCLQPLKWSFCKFFNFYCVFKLLLNFEFLWYINMYLWGVWVKYTKKRICVCVCCIFFLFCIK
jgi:hypothetical protein